MGRSRWNRDCCISPIFLLQAKKEKRRRDLADMVREATTVPSNEAPALHLRPLLVLDPRRPELRRIDLTQNAIVVDEDAGIMPPPHSPTAQDLAAARRDLDSVVEEDITLNESDSSFPDARAAAGATGASAAAAPGSVPSSAPKVVASAREAAPVAAPVDGAAGGAVLPAEGVPSGKPDAAVVVTTAAAAAVQDLAGSGKPVKGADSTGAAKPAAVAVPADGSVKAADERAEVLGIK